MHGKARNFDFFDARKGARFLIAHFTENTEFGTPGARKAKNQSGHTELDQRSKVMEGAKIVASK